VSPSTQMRSCMHETQRASARNSGLPDLLAKLAADCSNARPNRPGAKPSKLPAQRQRRERAEAECVGS
jgi:hypothetical protein